MEEADAGKTAKTMEAAKRVQPTNLKTAGKPMELVPQQEAAKPGKPAELAPQQEAAKQVKPAELPKA
eukprot:12295145-Karenia_brevis.AAC.1